MGRMDFGNTAELIGQVTDVNQLQQMLKNPQYAGFTSVIIARLTEINRMQQAEAGAQPEAPTVAQQAMSGQVQPEQQAMAKGGIVAFRHGGQVRGFKEGGDPKKGGDTNEWLHDRDREYFGNTKREAAKAAEMIEKTKGPMLKPVVALAGLTHIGLGGVADAVDPLARGLRYGVTATPYDTPFGQSTHTTPAEVPPAASTPAKADPKGLPALAPMTEQELDLPALGGSGGYRVSNGGGKGPKSLTEYYNERKALYDAEKPKPITAEEQARLANNAHWDQVQHSFQAMGQSANKNPHLGILGHGIEGSTAGKAYAEKHQADADADAAKRAEADRLDRKAMLESADREYGADSRAARANEATYAGINAQLKAPALLAARIRRRVLDLINLDRAKGINRPDKSYYEIQAVNELDPTFYRANVGSGDKSRATYEKAIADAKKSPTYDPTARLPSFEEWSGSGSGTAAPTYVIEG